MLLNFAFFRINGVKNKVANATLYMLPDCKPSWLLVRLHYQPNQKMSTYQAPIAEAMSPT
jgi:hypothetical protein